MICEISTFGQGGALLQIVNRDDQRFAMKCSSIGIRVNGELIWRDVFKDPITDSGKRSKKGRVTLYRREDGTFYSGAEDWTKDALMTVYADGMSYKTYTFDEVRENSARGQ
jgi:nicotinamide phosphoribosyltransferase